MSFDSIVQQIMFSVRDNTELCMLAQENNVSKQQIIRGAISLTLENLRSENITIATVLEAGILIPDLIFHYRSPAKRRENSSPPGE